MVEPAEDEEVELVASGRVVRVAGGRAASVAAVQVAGEQAG